MARILLADDEEGLRLLLGRQLKRSGHEVIPACDGQQAAELLGSDTFDLIVSDMKMPRMDGMALLAHARTVAPDTEFIVLTGHGNLENAVEAFKTGNVFDYLLKPLEDIAELSAIVERALERKKLREENGQLVKQMQEHIVQLEEVRAQLAYLAERDGLTGLLNYRAIHQRLEDMLAGTENVAVCLLDMDSFKMLNDTYGHPVGDEILRHISRIIAQSCAENYYAGRCGGDEFMLVLPGITGRAACLLAEQIRQNIHDTPFVNPEGTALPICLCFGVADTTATGRSSVSLLTAADGALYESKRTGGDQVTLHMVDQDADQPLQYNAYTVLDGLVTAVDHKDRYTRLHSEHMTGFALQIAEKMGMSDNTLEIVRIAGLLHDVGKIGVPDTVLRKPGNLTEEEYEVMKTHVTLSAAIIHGLPHLPDILDAVAHHHERWDGKGYPFGKKGEEIPLLGRVMAVADAFSAMTLDRPYRAGIPVEQALDRILQGAGSQFDPQIAELFVQMMRAKNQQWRKAA